MDVRDIRAALDAVRDAGVRRGRLKVGDTELEFEFGAVPVVPQSAAEEPAPDDPLMDLTRDPAQTIAEISRRNFANG